MTSLRFRLCALHPAPCALLWLLLLSALFSPLSAQVSLNQWVFQKRASSTGPLTPYGVTGQNSKAFGLDGSGNPTMLTISSGLTVGTTSITSGTSGTLLKNNAGTLSEVATSTGGNGASDDGKVAIYNNGILGASALSISASGRTADLSTTALMLNNNGATQSAAFQGPDTLTGNRVYKGPDVSGTIITTGNLSSITETGTITSGAWNGTAIASSYIADSAITSAKISDGTIVNADISASAAIAISKLATDPTNASNLSSGTVPDARLPGLGWQSETLTYYRQIIAASSYIDADTLGAIDKFITTGKTEGWWALLVEVWPFVGRDFTAALQKLKYASAAALTNNSIPTTDYTQEDGIGPSTSVSGHYLTTGFTPSSSGISNANIFFGASLIGNPTVVYAGGHVISDDQTGSSNDHAVWATQQGNSWGLTTGYQALSNHEPRVVSTNIASGSQWQFADGIMMVAAAKFTGSSDTTAPITVFRSERFGTAAYTIGKLGMVVFGTGMTQTQATNCHKAIVAFEKAVGRKMFQGEPLLTIGDSITAGQLVSSYITDPWALKLARSNGKRLINVGLPSAYLRTDGVTATGIYPQRAMYAAVEARDAVISIGINDIAGDPLRLSTGTSATISDFQTKLQSTIQALLDVGKRVTVVAPGYRDTAYLSLTCARAYCSAAAAACAATTPKVLFVDGDRAFRDAATPASYMQDSLHPNTTGHDRLWKFIDAAVRRGELIREPSVDLPSIAAGATDSSTTVEILGAATGDTVTLGSADDAWPSGIAITARVTSSNTVTINATNLTAGTIDAAAFRLRVVVKK